VSSSKREREKNREGKREKKREGDVATVVFLFARVPRSDSSSSSSVVVVVVVVVVSRRRHRRRIIPKEERALVRLIVRVYKHVRVRASDRA